MSVTGVIEADITWMCLPADSAQHKVLQAILNSPGQQSAQLLTSSNAENQRETSLIIRCHIYVKSHVD